MIKHTRFLKLCTDTDVIQSSKAPEPIDEWDGSCPACGSTDYRERITIVQRGWDEDDCITVCQCQRCHEAFHYYYQVAAMNLLENTAPAD